jgi:hypothetical protein
MGCLVFKNGLDKIDVSQIPKDLWDIDVTDIEGVSKKMNDYRDNNTAFIFVNVACK